VPAVTGAVTIPPFHPMYGREAVLLAPEPSKESA